MFENFIKLKHKKSVRQAIVFYFFCLICITLFSYALSAFLYFLSTMDHNASRLGIDTFFTFIATTFLSFVILQEKELLIAGYLFFIILTAVLTIYLGASGGLIVVAYLTTVPKTGTFN